MPVDSAFKQLLLSALDKPQILSFPTKAEAHTARFQAYNAFKVMRKEGDTFADVKEMLEFIVKPQQNGTATLAVQRKTTNLMQILSGIHVKDDADNPTPWIAQPPVTTTLQKDLQKDLQRTTPKEIDPTDPRDAKILRRMEINDWLEDKEKNMNFKYTEACAILAYAGDVTLEQFKELLSSRGID